MKFRVVLCAVALLAASCTSEPESNKSDNKSKPTAGGTLRLGLTQVQTIDPAKAATVDEVLLSDLMYDGLTRLDGTKVVPALARKWTPSPDAKAWDFTLRTATFDDGTPITAEDVKFSFDRLAGRQTASAVGSALRDVVGYEEAHVTGTSPALLGVAVASPRVVRVTLSSPDADFPRTLAHPAFGVVSQSEVVASATGFPAEPSVSSQSFELRSASVAKVELRARTKSPAHVSTVTASLYPSPTAARKDFLAKKLDWMRLTPAQASEIDNVQSVPYAGTLFFAFNTANPAVSDPAYREALVQAVDRGAIVRKLYGVRAKPIDGVVAPELPGAATKPCRGCTYSPAKAKAFLKGAYPGGAPLLVVDHDDDPSAVAIANELKKYWQTAGQPVQLRPHTSANYPAMVTNPTVQVFRLGWIPVSASAGGVLPQLFGSGSPDNLVGLRDPQLDALLATARTTLSQPARDKALAAAEQRALDLVPVLPVSQVLLLSTQLPAVQGLEVNVLGSFDADAVWLRVDS